MADEEQRTIGVTFDPSRHGDYKARITYKSRIFHIARRPTLHEAKVCYDQAALALRGPGCPLNYPLLNFPLDDAEVAAKLAALMAEQGGSSTATKRGGRSSGASTASAAPGSRHHPNSASGSSSDSGSSGGAATMAAATAVGRGAGASCCGLTPGADAARTAWAAQQPQFSQGQRGSSVQSLLPEQWPAGAGATTASSAPATPSSSGEVAASCIAALSVAPQPETNAAAAARGMSLDLARVESLMEAFLQAEPALQLPGEGCSPAPPGSPASGPGGADGPAAATQPCWMPSSLQQPYQSPPDAPPAGWDGAAVQTNQQPAAWPGLQAAPAAMDLTAEQQELLVSAWQLPNAAEAVAATTDAVLGPGHLQQPPSPALGPDALAGPPLLFSAAGLPPLPNQLNEAAAAGLAGSMPAAVSAMQHGCYAVHQQDAVAAADCASELDDPDHRHKRRPEHAPEEAAPLPRHRQHQQRHYHAAARPPAAAKPAAEIDSLFAAAAGAAAAAAASANVGWPGSQSSSLSAAGGPQVELELDAALRSAQLLVTHSARLFMQLAAAKQAQGTTNAARALACWLTASEADISCLQEMQLLHAVANAVLESCQKA